jgi:hypothetical protein
MLGFAVDTADTAISFMHNDGVGVATKETIAVQPALATNNVYDFLFIVNQMIQLFIIE